MNLKRIAVMVNSAMSKRITTKNIFGAEHIVVEGCGAIICDSVMNRIYYSEAEVKKLCNKTTGIVFAPVGHPVNEAGQHISASTPEGIHQGYVGAITFNYRMSGDVLICDLAIDPARAATTEQGKEVLRRIKENIDTDMSTGLMLYLVDKKGIGIDGSEYDYEAVDMALDHNAILLAERGAATTLQGVGMFANSDGVNEEAQVTTVTVNASMPAMNLPAAPSDHVWDEAAAITRIKEFTKSTSAPSSNYRRFFMSFDRTNVADFGSYKLPFADIIDGRPHVVKAAIDGATSAMTNAGLSDEDKAQAQAIVVAYQAKFKEPGITGNSDKAGLFQKVINYVEKLIGVKYTPDADDKTVLINHEGERQMREMILNALKAAGVSTDGLNDSQLMEAYNKSVAGAAKSEMTPEQKAAEEKAAKEKADKEKEMGANSDLLKAINALTEKVNGLEQKTNAGQAAELDALAAKVEGLKIGINAAQAKALGAEGMKSVLAANGGEVVFNANSAFDGKGADLAKDYAGF